MTSGIPKGERYKRCTITTRPEEKGGWSGVIAFPNKDKKHVPQAPSRAIMLKNARITIDDYFSCVDIANKFLLG